MMRSAVDQRVEQAHLAFALDLHRAIAPDANRAVCLSPYSVASALGLVASGAAGDTRSELATLLLGDPGGSLAEHAAVLAEAAALTPDQRGEQPILAVSNSLWADQNLAVLPDYVDEVLGWPGGAIRQAPFHTDPGKARNLINADVADTTHDLIRDLVPDGAITRDTLATLVNALYLKTSWRNPFTARGTDDRPFHAPGGRITVPIMRLTKRLGYAAADGWQVVVLPAAGGVEAAVLLPDAALPAAEATLTGPGLAALLAQPQPTEVDLYLPKFRVSAEAPLKPVLESLGVSTMFGGAADLRGISDTPLRVDSAWHQAVLTIDEQGLEGAAATALTMVRMAMARGPEPVVVRVERPFLMLVRHPASGAVYFLSRVVAPA